MITEKTGRGLCAALVLGLLAWGIGGTAMAQVRSPSRYHILARTRAAMKDYHLSADGATCNIGVNNAGGMFNSERGFTMHVGELVADVCSGSGTVPACFCNVDEGPGFGVPCSTWTPPILPDESTATFVKACDTAMAGMDYPAAFVSGTQDVTCGEGQTDCKPVNVDMVLGNGICDLMPGNYRLVNPRRGCELALRGVYNLADYSADKRVRLRIKEPTTLNVKGATQILSFGDGNSMENECGLLRVNFEGASVNLGRGAQGTFQMDLCAPNALLRMRNSNTLQGHFFADEVRSDFNNEGKCCGRGECGCFDVVAPVSITVGQSITLSGGCNLESVSAVLVCDVPCPITSRAPDHITCTPAASGTCKVRGVSGSGEFISNTMVTITP